MAEIETPPRSSSDTPTRSLRAAMNPQARMQELLQRSAPSEPQQHEDATTLPVGSATSSVVAQNTSSTDSSAAADTEESAAEPVNAGLEETSPPSSAVAQKSSSAVAQKRGSTKVQKPSSVKTQKRGSAVSTDPVRQAMLGMLAQPYPDDMEEGAMTVTSVKIPKPIWERLEYARTITKRDKQDIIADALRLYFDTLLETSEVQSSSNSGSDREGED